MIEGKKFLKKYLSGLRMLGSTSIRTVNDVPKQPSTCPDDMKAVCKEFPVHVRLQYPGANHESGLHAPVSWVPTNFTVSDVVYPDKNEMGETFVKSGEKTFLEDMRDADEGRENLARIENTLSNQQVGGGVDAEERTGDKHGALKSATHMPTSDVPQGEHQGDEHVARTLDKVQREETWKWINFPATNVRLINICISLESRDILTWPPR